MSNLIYGALWIKVKVSPILKALHMTHRPVGHLPLKVDFSDTINDKEDILAGLMTIDNFLTIDKEHHIHIAYQRIHVRLLDVTQQTVLQSEDLLVDKVVRAQSQTR